MTKPSDRFGWSADDVVLIKKDGQTVITAAGVNVDPNGEPHTGGMIALVPSEADLDRLQLETGEPRGMLHLTLQFLGTAADIPDANVQTLRDELEMISGQRESITGEAFAAAMFNPTGDESCWVLQIGGESVSEMHLASIAVVGAATYDDWSVPEQHQPWCAHVTLAYTDDPTLVEEVTTRVGPITFDRLRLALGSEVTDYPFGSEASVSDDEGEDEMTVIDQVQASDTVMEPDITFTTARIRALTLLDIPAFVEARIEATGPVDADGFLPIAGVACVEDTPTGDGRIYTAGSLRWEEGGYPFRWDMEDDGAHLGSVTIGRIDTTERVGTDIKIVGRVDTNLPWGAVAAMAIERGMITGVSVDMDDIPEDSVEMVLASASGSTSLPIADEDTEFDAAEATARILEFADGDAAIVASGHLYIPTDADPEDPGNYRLPFADIIDDVLTAVPAGIDAAAQGASGLLDSEEITQEDFDAMMAILEPYFELMADEGVEDVVIVDDEIEASAWSEFGNLPPLPAAAFQEPNLKLEDEHVHYENGRVYGWVAQNGVCHDAFSGSCVTAPLGSVDLRTFLRQPLTLDDGSTIQVGAFTMGVGHDDDGADTSSMKALFDDTRTVAGIVTVGVNAHGMWFSGVAAPWLSDWDKHVFAACRPSGHWRRLRSGGWSLRAVLSVPVPGFTNRVSKIAAAAFVSRSNIALAASAVPALEVEPVIIDQDVEFIQLVAAAIVDEMETRARIRAEVEELSASLNDERREIASSMMA